MTDIKVALVERILCVERGGSEAQRRPEIDSRGPVKFWTHHTDHFVALLVELNRPADDTGVGAEHRFPGAIGEHDDAVCAGLVLFRSERAAKIRRGAKNFEPPLRDLRADQTHGKTAGGVIEIQALLQRH
jgi:hypothetical protein